MLVLESQVHVDRLDPHGLGTGVESLIKAAFLSTMVKTMNCIN